VRNIAPIADQANVDRAGTVGEWAQSALAAAERSTPGRRVAVAAAAAAAAAFHRSDYDTARDLLEPLLRAGVPADCPTPSLPHIILGITEVLDGRPEFVEAFQEGHRALDQLDGDQRFGHCMLWSFAADCFCGWKVPEALTEARAALSTARELGNPTAISNALFAMGWALADDDPDAALAALDEAFALAIDHDDMIVSMMWPIGLSVRASILARRGAGREALVALKAAFEYSAEAGDRSNMSGNLYLGLETLVELGIDEPAAIWAGAYRARPEFTEPAYGRGLEAFEAAVGIARRRLGDTHFEAAAARGAAMSYDEIVAHALATVDALINDPAVPDG